LGQIVLAFVAAVVFAASAAAFQPVAAFAAWCAVAVLSAVAFAASFVAAFLPVVAFEASFAAVWAQAATVAFPVQAAFDQESCQSG
jgi:hypothetical protein